jgi:hypothetical protein
VGEDDDVVHGKDWEQLGLRSFHMYRNLYPAKVIPNPK